MSTVYQCPIPELADSTSLFQPKIHELIIPEMGRLFSSADSNFPKVPVPYLFPWIRPLTINCREFCILIVPQPSGRFVARTSTRKFNATGQGKTEADALQDIKDAIELLMEEEASPSGDATWPEDCQ
jgi:predicted RNase H-like HicB family nuclease